jgi:tetratricopeptide (TPR) repeat protein
LLHYSLLLRCYFLLVIFCICGCFNNPNENLQSIEEDSISILEALSSKLDQDSSNPELLYQRASFYLYNNDLLLAKKDIEMAYSIIKNDVDILLTRANIYYALNETRVAKETWERCLSVDPNNIICRQHLTSLLCAVNSERCKSMIDTLFILSKGVVPINLIAYLKELGEYSKCIELLSNSILVDSNDLEALHLLSMIYADTSSYNSYFDIELAKFYFDKIITLSPADRQVYYNLAKFKQDILEYNDALEHYNHIIKIDSSNQQVYYNMGFCAMQSNDYNTSIDYFSKAILIDNSLLLAYHARAYVYELNNQLENSRSDWKYCLMLSPSYIPALKGLSRLK